jgi:tRNA (guanine-N7-)-methyltransferase
MDQKYLRSFGRVKGHTLRKTQQELINEFLPRITPNIDNLSKRIWFEIGFGSGEHIIQLIDTRADDVISIVGCEPYINGSVKIIQYIKDNSIDNVYIYNKDARELIERFEINSVERFFILFPDPWPKKRHYKRRIISQSIITLLMSKLTDDGVITIATDHQGYAEWIAEVLQLYQYQHKLVKTPKECAKEGVLTRYCLKALSREESINVFRIKNIKN